FLRFADIPRCLAGIEVLECAAIGYGTHDCSSLGCSHRYTLRERVSSRFATSLQVFVEPNAIAERVNELHALGIIKRRLDPWPQVLVVLADSFSLKTLNAGHPGRTPLSRGNKCRS